MVYNNYFSYFNPRSHERSDTATDNDEIAIVISIHAPTRGATTAKTDYENQLAISIHAPTRGATLES